jgi:hypothetical protein
MVTQEEINEKIKKIKPFFEQLTFFFLFLIMFISYDVYFVVSPMAKYTLTVFFMGWSISLIIQELYLYGILKPIILGKRWEIFVQNSFRRKKKGI